MKPCSHGSESETSKLASKERDLLPLPLENEYTTVLEGNSSEFQKGFKPEGMERILVVLERCDYGFCLISTNCLSHIIFFFCFDLSHNISIFSCLGSLALHLPARGRQTLTEALHT